MVFILILNHRVFGWNDKNEVYLSNVSRTISWLDEHIADDIKLSESIPNYYPPDFLLDIKDHVDGVSVMCENTNIEFVVRKVIEEQSEIANNCFQRILKIEQYV